MTGVEQTVAELDIKADAYIPEKYIEASASRLDCYKQIAEIRGVEDYKRVCLSIEENYGKLPKEVLNLLIIAVLKSYAAKLNIRKIAVSSAGGEIVLPSVQTLADGKFSAALDAFAGKGAPRYVQKSRGPVPPRKRRAETHAFHDEILEIRRGHGALKRKIS